MNSAPILFGAFLPFIAAGVVASLRVARN
jgi:hypothetical protein